jgi:hypothetical protein
MVDGHLVTDILAVVRQVGRHPCIQRDFSLRHQLHDEHGGELFGDGAEPVFDIRCVGDIPLHVGQAVSFLEDHLPRFRDQGRPAELSGVVVLPQEGIDLGRCVLREGTIVGDATCEGDQRHTDRDPRQVLESHTTSPERR